MSWICPWCGVENDTEMPEGRHTANCRACKKVVPSREGLRNLKTVEAGKLRKKWDEIENEITQLEYEKDRIEASIRDIESASFDDRDKVRIVAKDQVQLPFEVSA